MSRKIEEFKAFVKSHPGLIDEVKDGRRTWKELYEEWYVLGDEDERWSQYTKLNEEENVKGIAGVFSKLKNINLDEVQKNIVEMKGLVSTIQEFVRDVQPEKRQIPPNHYPSRAPYYHQYYNENQKF